MSKNDETKLCINRKIEICTANRCKGFKMEKRKTITFLKFKIYFLFISPSFPTILIFFDLLNSSITKPVLTQLVV